MRGAGESVRDRRRLFAGRHLLLPLHEEPGARFGGAEDDRAAAEDPRSDGPVERAGIGGERHAGRDIARHHPVLRDADEEEVEEEALVLGRLVASAVGG